MSNNGKVTGKGKVKPEIDHVADMVKFVNDRHVSRQVMRALESWLKEVCVKFNAELSDYGESVGTPSG